MGERTAAPAGPSVALLALGAIVSLAWAVGWTAAGLNSTHAPAGALPAALYGLGQVLAALAPPAWFALCVWLARGPRQLAGWAVAGVVLLAPLPLVIGAA